ncbi:MAG: glycosyl transferase [Candidatus Marinimicrobia bacterium]|nr:glycosyl transferase [Candidatus Neomarinimicrobiota bacterium]
MGVSGGIDWFFEQEEEGIILEDDCLPSQSFFPFCERMLERYQHDRRIWMISGFNPRYPSVKTSCYFYSENPSVWGWASWADRWSSYDVQMNGWPDVKLVEYMVDKFPKYVHRYYLKAFDGTKRGKTDTWDYQLSYKIFSNHGLTVKPKANLISNLGVEGAHASKKDKNHFIGLGEIIDEQGFSICCMYPDVKEDDWFYRTRLRSRFRILKRVIGFVRRILKEGI